MSETVLEQVVQLESLPASVKQFVKTPEKKDGEPQEPIEIFSLPNIGSLDTSGSTGSSLRSSSTTILQVSKEIVKEFYPQGNTQIISWNSNASLAGFDQLRSYGGTRPETMFACLRGIQTLVVTTDGDIDEPEKVIPFVLQSTLLHVIAIYVGPRNIAPAKLNLPVFAPFMNIPGSFVLCHYDGVDLRLLMKQRVGPEIPSIDFEIGAEVKWEQFPKVTVPELMKLKSRTIAKVGLPAGHFKLPESDALFNFSAFANAFKFNAEQFNLDEITQFVINIFPELISDIKRSNLTVEAQGFLRDWERLATPHAKQQTEKLIQAKSAEFQTKVERATFLHRRIQNGDVSGREELAALVKELYAEGLEHQKLIQTGARAITSLYNSLMVELGSSGNSQPKSYTLSDLSRTSNRAKRAQLTSSEAVSVDQYDLSDGCKVSECDVCAASEIQALLLVAASDEQVQYNTNDYSLNDALHLGPLNKTSLPASSLCVYCATFLLSNGVCPYTRQPIKSLLVAVNSTPIHNNLIFSEVSKALFGGARLGIENQAILSCLDATRDRFAPSVIEHFEKYLLFQSQANLSGPYGQSKKLINAMEAVAAANIKEYDSESWLSPLRNKSLNSMSLIVRMLLKHHTSQPTDSYHAVLLRLFGKQVAGRILAKAKKEGAGMMTLLLQQDLFDIAHTGIILEHSERFTTLETSKLIQYTFPNFEETVLEPIRKYCQAIEIELNDFVPPNILSVLLYSAVKAVDPLMKEETFIVHCAGNDKFFRAAFWGRIEEIDTFNSELQSHYEERKRKEEEAHDRMIAFSPVSLRGGIVTSCSACATLFVKPEEYDMPVRELSELLRARRAEHFSAHAPTSAFANVHQTVLSVINQQRFVSAKTVTREMVLVAVNILRNRNKGNIHHERFLYNLVAVFNDALTKRNNGVPTIEKVESLEVIIKQEIDYIRAHGPFGVAFASTEGLSANDVETLASPLSDEEMRKFFIKN